MKTYFFSVASLSALLMLGACAESPYVDIHDVPRETKAWENLDISAYSSVQLLAHLNRLTNEATAAAAAGEPVEFHHLEVAMTPTLGLLQTKAADNAQAQATLAELSTLAYKLHEAGHDGNSQMGAKIAAALADLSARLTSEL